MTVKELKEIIKKIPDDLLVYIGEDLIETAEWAQQVSKVTHLETAYVKSNRIAKRPCKDTQGAEKSLIIY